VCVEHLRFIVLADSHFLSLSAEKILNAVDLYNSVTGKWSTAQLSVARYSLAATSVGTVAIFAGGAKSPVGGEFLS
jgi:hypothetical protein